MLLEVSELFEEVVEEQLKMAVREVPPIFGRWFSDQRAENMLRYIYIYIPVVPHKAVAEVSE